MQFLLKIVAIVGGVGLAACGSAQIPVAQASTQVAAAEPFAIAANPLATQAGLNVLKRGGSAVDAAVAIQAMLSLVEPQSSGLGGGAFMTYFDARTGKISVYDGREVAPAQATSSMFLDAAGKPLPFDTAVISGRATGVPGAVKMLGLAHHEHGKLPWSSLFADAERTADQGFIVSPRLERMIHADYAENHAPDVIAYFSKPDGSLLNAGDRLVNKPYAESGRALHRLDRREDGCAHPRRTARGLDDDVRPRQLQGHQARPGVRPLPDLRFMRAAPAIERGRADRADADPPVHRHRRAGAE
jgi:gamma-glutamyltranspeptidase/glutathione hydrolase